MYEKTLKMSNFEQKLKNTDDETLKRFYHGLRQTSAQKENVRTQQFMAVCREIQSRCIETNKIDF